MIIRYKKNGLIYMSSFGIRNSVLDEIRDITYIYPNQTAEEIVKELNGVKK